MNGRKLGIIEKYLSKFVWIAMKQTKVCVKGWKFQGKEMWP